MTIKEVIALYKEKPTDENLVVFLETLVSNSVFIPVFEDKKPDILADMDGKRFYPVFSTVEESDDEYVNITWEEISFTKALQIVQDLENADAIVINPYTDNVRLPKDIVDGLYEQFTTIS